MRKTIAISLEGDAILRDALNQLAKEKGVSVGKVVADAINTVHGEELSPLLSFFRKRDYENSQSTSESVTEVAHA